MNTLPVTIEEGGINLPFIKFSYIIEDRRPNLNHKQARETVGYKYKISISIKFFRYYRSFLFHTIDFPYIWRSEV